MISNQVCSARFLGCNILLDAIRQFNLFKETFCLIVDFFLVDEITTSQIIIVLQWTCECRVVFRSLFVKHEFGHLVQ